MAKTSDFLLLGAAAVLGWLFLKSTSQKEETAAIPPTTVIPTVDPVTAAINELLAFLDKNRTSTTENVVTTVKDIITSPPSLNPLDYTKLDDDLGKLVDNVVNILVPNTSDPLVESYNYQTASGMNLMVDASGTVTTGTYTGINILNIDKPLSTPSGSHSLNLEYLIGLLGSVGYVFRNADIRSAPITDLQYTGIVQPATQALKDIFTSDPYAKITDLPFWVIEANTRALFSTIGETSFTMFTPYQDKTATTSSYLQATGYNYMSTLNNLLTG